MKKIILVILVTAAGCRIAPIHPARNCCQRLDARTTMLQNFNRYCKVLVVDQQTNTNHTEQESIQNRLRSCRFVFGVSTNMELMSDRPDENHSVHSHRLFSEGGWQIPLDCDPNEPTCEEF